MSTAAAITSFEHIGRFYRQSYRVSDLGVDYSVQRALIPARLAYFMREMRQDGLDMVVSMRDDGRVVVLDGNHRREALMRLGHGDWMVNCKVFTGLSLSQEAALFRMLNNARAAGVYEDFDKAVVAGDPAAVAIVRIVQAAGLRVSRTSGDGVVACVSALREVYGSPGGPRSLEMALMTAVGAWGPVAPALEATLLRGLALVYQRHGDAIDSAVMVGKLAKFPGGPSGLLGEARALRKLRTGTIPTLIAAVVTELYNRGRRSHRLDFTT